MKNIAFVIICMTIVLTSSCVQKSAQKTITFIVDVSKVKDIKKVGLRGKEKPLDWRNDLVMTPIEKDSLYTATVTFLTGYKFTEIKFVVNDEFELQDKDNRKVMYNNSDTTIYQAVFDVQK